MTPSHLKQTRPQRIGGGLIALAGLLGFMVGMPLNAAAILSVDHYVDVVSIDPALAGQRVALYVRERATTAAMHASNAQRVVLFVHGAGTPAEVSFDVPYQDFSWMRYLAAAGYDVFSVDMTGYGRSTRPVQMKDKCNLAPEQQKVFGVNCPQSYPGALTNVGSDWHDIDAAVAYIRKLRHVQRVNLFGWSQGGPRAGGWTALHPEQVAKLVLLAPAYNRATASATPALPVPGPVFNVQSHEDFLANWQRQATCNTQFEPATADAIWSAMLASDPVGASWSPAVRRAPIASSSWGWTTERVKGTQTPTLLATGENDKQVNPERVHDLYEDLGSAHKVLVDLGCASHNAMWEKNHRILFQASLEFLQRGTVNGRSAGVLKLGH